MGNLLSKKKLGNNKVSHIHINCEICGKCIICDNNHKCSNYYEFANSNRTEESWDNISLGDMINEEDVIDKSKNWALLVGINYTGQDGEMNSCIKDIEKVKHILINTLGFDENKIILLTDKPNNDKDKLPTQFNIINELSEMVNRAERGELKQLWFHYLGYGSFEEDDSDNETYEKDNIIVPVDWESNGPIIGDDLYDFLIDKMPENTKTFMFIDSCHSDNIIKLNCDFKYRKENPIKSSWILEHEYYEPKGEFIMISGHKKNNDITEKYCCVMTNSLVVILSKLEPWGYINFIDLMTSLYELSSVFNQIPVLSSNHMYDLSKLKFQVDWM